MMATTAKRAIYTQGTNNESFSFHTIDREV
jgi:hypothetical protein